MKEETNLECPLCQGNTVDLFKGFKLFLYECRRCVFETAKFKTQEEATKEYKKVLKEKKNKRE